MDRMDDIWKDRFNSEELPVADWNSPDDLVWENVADQTVRKNKRRFALWWFFGFLCFVLIGMALLTWANGYDEKENIGKIQSSLLNEQEALNETVINNNENIILNESKSENQDSATETKQVVNEAKTKKANQSPIKNTKVEKQSTSFITEKEKTNTAQVITDNLQAGLLGINPLENPSILNPTVKGNQEEGKAKESILKGSSILLGGVQSSAFNQAVITLENLPLIFPNDISKKSKGYIQKVKTKTPLSLAASVGATYWQHNISEQYTSDLSAADFNYTDEVGYFVDLDISIPLGKRFSIQAGLGYEQIDVSSGHNAQLSYDPAQENSNPNNNYTVDLATPYGLSAAEFSFERNQDVGEDPVELLVDFNSAHTIRNFSLPLRLVYAPFGNAKKISPYIKAGAGINYLSGISNDIHSIDTHHSAIQYDDSGTSNFNAPDIQKWHYDYRLGVGAQYKWQRGLALSVNYEYIKGINAIFQQNDYKTTISRHHFSIGLTKTLFSLH